ncbi:MAG: hypothetical protein WAV21_00530 [Minisyncoccia bacterium]
MTSFYSFLYNVEQQIINPLIILISLAAFIVFVWGVIDFIRGADDAEKRKIGQSHIIWGIIGLSIIFGAKAIITIALNTFGISTAGL